MDDIVIRHFREEDAEGVALLLNESDPAWPGTLTGGIPFDRERVLRQHREMGYLAVLVAEGEGRILGYCSLSRDFRDPEVAYVAFLNVHPAWHGRGIGKRLLLRAVEEAKERGFSRVTLNTWAGNEKAVPLYKKTGFFWAPGTQVRMENFVPLILRLPWANELLSGVDWYQALKRETEIAEDKELWHSREVYRYRFEHEGKALEVLIDREAQAPCALYAEDFAAELWPEVPRPVAGLPFRLSWRLENRGRNSKTVALFATGDAGVECSEQSLLELSPGEVRTGELACCIDPELRDNPQRPAPAVRLNLLADRRKLSLACGVRPRPPIEVSSWPKVIVVPADVPCKRTFVLTNRHSSPLKGELALDPLIGATVSPGRLSFHLAPGKSQDFRVRVEARPGGHVLSGEISLEDAGAFRMQPLPLLSRRPGEVVACQTEDRIWTAGEGFVLEARSRGGRLIFWRGGTGHPLLHQGEELGPPFWPGELGTRCWQLDLVEDRGTVEIRLKAESGRFPGLTVEKVVRVGASPVVEIAYRLSSRAETPRKVRIAPLHWGLPDRPVRIAFPSPAGVVEERLAGFPEGEDDFPKELPEDWCALLLDDVTIGVVPAETVEWDFRWRWGWRSPTVELAPGERRVAHRYWLWVGRGTWQDVRQLWAYSQGKSVKRCETVPLVGVEVSPPVILGQKAQGEVELAVRTFRGRPFHGALEIRSPQGWGFSPGRVELEASRAQAARLQASWRKENPPRIGEGKIILHGGGEERHFSFPLVSLPPEPPQIQEVEEQGHELFLLEEEGRRLAVAPSFAGALISWQEREVEQLLSAFPKARPFLWLSPWFGGIHPYLYAVSLDQWRFPGKLYEEEFRSEAWKMEQGGVKWQGVRLSTRPQAEDLKGLSVEVIYTSPGGGLLGTLLRVKNMTARPRCLEGGFLGFLAPGGEVNHTVLSAEGLRRVRSKWHAWPLVRGWAAAQGPDGAGFMLAAPREVGIIMLDLGPEGGHLGLGQELSLGPYEEGEVFGWWISLSPEESPSPWRGLSRLPWPAG